MATPKVMRLINPSTGEMLCKHCASEHYANLAPGGRYRRGSWQCLNPNCPSKENN
jgi:hypothetical protein